MLECYGSKYLFFVTRCINVRAKKKKKIGVLGKKGKKKGRVAKPRVQQQATNQIVRLTVYTFFCEQ